MKLLYVAQAGPFPSYKNRVIGAVRGTEIVEFIEILEDSRFSQDGQRNHGGAQVSDDQPIGACSSVEVIGCLSTATAGHILAHNRWVSRNIFL